MLNLFLFMGRVIEDPRVFSSDGYFTIRFPVSVSRPYKKKGAQYPESDTFHLVCFGETASRLNQFARKGRIFIFQGNIRQSRWIDKEGNKRYSYEFVVEQFFFSAQPKPQLDENGKALPVYNPNQSALEAFKKKSSETGNSELDIPFDLE